ncbi:nickel pincer cofactor biosynthesis protein LarC [Halorussus sp. MSC15.2]|uniref:nickel pincer cofactor biosynthesis protein LarC n=1 Tax=Halorussus sp. MSC15.2 TaxID=2283638 RepID=UPI0013D81695|nr:nickel pincer cofactor biosynthesis protein LarC [Halorussus sp. MSC15.2]NEU55989.1 nickel pincer cofactor biosynthesis protein LarC [Halorussus sp. MSC15.2]
MKTLAFDGRMGASGDMILAALLAAGADRDALTPVEDTLPVRYEVGETDKNGISATTVSVLLDDEGDEAEGDDEAPDRDSSHAEGHSNDGDAHGHDHHGHDHSHDEDAHSHDRDDGGHSHDHDEDAHDHTHAEGSGPLRSYPEVVELVESMDLPESVERDALAVFELLGEAEANVHGTDLESTHFHEVGADDAIADVVGAALLLDDLHPERVVTTPLATGGGDVEMSHGVYPVPTPAVVEIAERADWSLRGGPVETELLTPTGAAVLAHFAEGVETLPSLGIDASGYGAGGYDFPDHPNVLRAMVGESAARSAAEGASSEGRSPSNHSSGRSPREDGETASEDGSGSLVRDDVAVLETNLDDAAPEILGGLQDSLAEVGARDVSVVPLTMKKSRPGHLVKVVCKPDDAETVARRLAEETGTLGVRQAGATHRWIAHREIESVVVDLDGERYEVDVKLASDDSGEVYDVSAEYDDCAAVASEAGVPVRDVMRRAENAARKS